jgi:hypothetical protein
MESEEKSGARARPLVIRGRTIRADEDGLICLNDIWSAAGYTKHQRPFDWMRLYTTQTRIQRVLKLITGKSGNYEKGDILRAYKKKVGKNAGTWADPRLALDYAEFLNPALAIEVKEIFLRYEAADPTLADDIMDRSSAEANEWIAKRSMGRAIRLGYTATLKNHGVEERKHYAECTNATYRGLFGKPASQLKKDKGLPLNGKLRDAMDLKELATVSFAEVLSTDRIEDEDCRGFIECREATDKVAGAVRQMIDCERKGRQKRLDLG